MEGPRPDLLVERKSIPSVHFTNSRSGDSRTHFVHRLDYLIIGCGAAIPDAFCTERVFAASRCGEINILGI